MSGARAQLLVWLMPLAILAGFLWRPVLWSILNLSPFQSLDQSSTHSYSTELISADPLAIYLESFLSPVEVNHLLELGAALFAPSLVVAHTSGPEVSTRRSSHSAFLPGKDTVVRVVKARVTSFLGFLAHDGVEVLQLVRYHSLQKVNVHFDWFETLPLDRLGRAYNRVASFYLYLDANCTAGETWFPHLPSPPATYFDEAHESRVFATQKSQELVQRYRSLGNREGLAVVPRAGNGIFWLNLQKNGSGDDRTAHAGLPVEEGQKIGMNIWVKKLAASGFTGQ